MVRRVFTGGQVFDGTGFVRVGNAVTRFRADARATALADGGVLLSGGSTPLAIPPVDRYDAGTRKWRLVGNMLLPRVEHSATLLRDGRVLIAGGVTCCNQTGEFFTESAEIYDPATDAFVATGSLGAPRGLHAAALLPDGRVLIAGGFADVAGTPRLSTEIFDPATGLLCNSHQAVTPCFLEACDPRVPYRVLNNTVTFLTFEADQGEDLNGDGDTDDLVLQTFNVAMAEATGMCSPSGASPAAAP